MTNRKIVEQIAKDKGVCCVECHLCPLYDGDGTCASDSVSLDRATSWLSDDVVEGHGDDYVVSKVSDKAQERKQRPVYSGVLKYFPLAIMEVAHCSWLGQQQHNPDKPLAWDRSKSGDELDAMMRHLLDTGGDMLVKDDDGAYHIAKVIWRLCASLEKELENG